MTCGAKLAVILMHWGKAHGRCEDQCTGILNALQAFPFAAWGDISVGKLDPLKVVAARNVETGYPGSQCGKTTMACEEELLEEYKVPVDRHHQRGS